MPITCQKPEGVAILLSHSTGSYHWEVLSISAPVDGVSEMQVEIEIYPGIDLVEEAVKIFIIMKNTYEDTTLYKEVLDQILGKMTADQKNTYQLKTTQMSHPGWVED